MKHKTGGRRQKRPNTILRPQELRNRHTGHSTARTLHGNSNGVLKVWGETAGLGCAPEGGLQEPQRTGPKQQVEEGHPVLQAAVLQQEPRGRPQTAA